MNFVKAEVVPDGWVGESWRQLEAVGGAALNIDGLLTTLLASHHSPTLTTKKNLCYPSIYKRCF
jgi:hypothetical protein